MTMIEEFVKGAWDHCGCALLAIVHIILLSTDALTDVHEQTT